MHTHLHAWPYADCLQEVVRISDWPWQEGLHFLVLVATQSPNGTTVKMYQDGNFVQALNLPRAVADFVVPEQNGLLGFGHLRTLAQHL